MMLAIIYAPLDDSPTSVSNAAGISLKEELDRRQIKNYYIPTRYCRREIFEEISEAAPEDIFILYAGHGERDKFLGSLRYQWRVRRKAMVDLDNREWLKGHILALSCWTAKELGKKVWEEELVESFCGCLIPMYVAYTKDDRDYKKDWVEVFGLVYPITLFETNEPERAFQEMKKAIEEKIKLYKLNHDKWIYAEHYASRFYSNFKNMKLYKR